MGRGRIIGMRMVLCLFLFAVNATFATAQRKVGEAGALFLLITNSARVNGMGGCALNVVDEQSPLYNPGALGLFHLDKLFSVSFPNTTDWLPQLDSDMKLKTFTISGGASSRHFGAEWGGPDIALGFAYSSLKMDYGNIIAVDEFGNYLNTVNPIDEADYYSAGIGFDYYARLGIGVTTKKIKSATPVYNPDLEPILDTAEADGYDFGLILELPVAELVQRVLQPIGSATSDYGVAFTPSFAYVYSNGGTDSLSYIDAVNPDPLPRMRKIGVGGYGALTYKSTDIFSLRMCWERDRWEIGVPYTIYRQGGELGAMDAAFFRFGSYADAAGQEDYNTYGFGLSLHGIVKWLLLTQPEIDNRILRYLATHVDFTVDYAKYYGIESNLNKTTFTNLTISF